MRRTSGRRVESAGDAGTLGMVSAYRMYVAGEWTNGESGVLMKATSPSTGEPIGTVPEGTREDVRRAIAAANDAWPGWAARSAFERAAAMDRVAEGYRRTPRRPRPDAHPGPGQAVARRSLR